MAVSDEKDISTVEAQEREQKHEHGNSTDLHRGLKARQVSMIAIGGAIGTGLIIGTGKALERAG